MTLDVNKYCAEKLKKLRLSKNLTQKELAEELGVTQQQIARYENNLRMFKQDFLFQLANYFQVSINDFFPPVFGNTSNILEDKMYEENVSLSQLSIITGIPVEEIKNIYDGKNRLPKPEDLIKISKALNDEPYYYLAGSGYVDDETLIDYDLYESGIRYLLSERDRQVLCSYVCSYWNSKTKKHIYTYTEVYNTIFDNEKKDFSINEVKKIVSTPNNITTEQLNKLNSIINSKMKEAVDINEKINITTINDINRKINSGDIIDISDLSDKDKEQIKYMIELMRKQ